ncbi:DedA family protein [hydrothermal vent metagenome]|uniref:DedA family protein n=1 Tax=hydrothermal vent metagenome TaxID=652676 RepID=A0A1W1BAJ1_9ZZZZ
MLYDFFAQHLNYPILFLWSILEGEIGLTLGGLLSKEGVLRFEYVIGIAVAGAFLGDLSVFLIGRFFSKKVDLWFASKKEQIDSVRDLFAKYGSWLIFFERYLYGAHIPTLLIIGSSNYSFVKFLLLDIVAVFLWALTFVTLGFTFDKEFVALLNLISKYLTIFVVLLLFIVILRKSMGGRSSKSS